MITGAIIEFCGAALIVTGFFKNEMTLMIGGAIVSMAGAFAILEGVLGWCLLRAIGIKTRL